MKILNWFGWISAGAGILMIILGVLSGLFLGRSIIPAVQHFVDFWIIADSFFLIAIMLFVINLKSNGK
jgi:hypothetical protein